MPSRCPDRWPQGCAARSCKGDRPGGDSSSIIDHSGASLRRVVGGARHRPGQPSHQHRRGDCARGRAAGGVGPAGSGAKAMLSPGDWPRPVFKGRALHWWQRRQLHGAGFDACRREGARPRVIHRRACARVRHADDARRRLRVGDRHTEPHRRRRRSAHAFGFVPDSPAMRWRRLSGRMSVHTSLM